MSTRRSAPAGSYVPALGFHRLGALYDPMTRCWSAAARIRRAVIDALGLAPGMRILELGAGPGRLAIAIKRRHPEVVVNAMDVDGAMIARARRNAAAAGVEIVFRHGDVTRLEQLDDLGRFDRVFATMVFHHLPPRAKTEALRGAREALAPEGRFVVVDFGIPRGMLQRALFTMIQQPLDGFRNTEPHRDGRYQKGVRSVFAQVEERAVWRTAAGTVEMLVCDP